MPWPTSQDYFEAVQNPRLNFGEPELRLGKPRLSPLGLPIVMSGNFADVYPIECPGKRVYAVKCFTREVHGQRDRYREISAYLQQVKLPFTVEFSYLDGEQGIRIRGQWYPILKMEWVEGTTLNQFVSENVQKPQMLEALGQLWVQLAQKLRDAHIAHADLQHGNVLLVPVPGAKAGTVKLKLIDYDGMFVPALANRASGELGHVNYQHPARFRDQVYSAEVDRFPHLVICTALRCLAVAGRELWEHHDNGDNLLFRQGDFEHPGSSPLFHELWKLADPTARALVGQLVLAARGPLGQEPHLSELLHNGHPPVLSASQKQQLDLLFSLGVPPRPAPAPQIAGPVLPVDGIVVACVCGQRFMAQSFLAGKTVACPTCGNAIHVPQPAFNPTPNYNWYANTVPQSYPAPRVSRVPNVLQRLDQFLLQLVGANNTLLHQFLRIVFPLVLLAAIIIPVTLVARNWNNSSDTKDSTEPPTGTLPITSGVDLMGTGRTGPIISSNGPARPDIAAAPVSPTATLGKSNQRLLVLGGDNPDWNATLVETLRQHLNLEPVLVSAALFDGTRTDLNQFDCIVLLNNDHNNNKISIGVPSLGQQAIIQFVGNGGGLVTSEWQIYNVGRSREWEAVLPATCGAYGGGTKKVYSQVGNVPELNAGVAPSFDVESNMEASLAAKPSAQVFYENRTNKWRVVVGWDYGKGRVISFATYITDKELSNDNYRRLLVNAVKWSAAKSRSTLGTTASANGGIGARPMTPKNDTKEWTSFAQPFVEKGYERVVGQVLEVRNSVSKRTVYTGQVVTISADVNADVAIMAQAVSISGTVKGDIDFLGQLLRLEPGAVVEGDIRVQAAQIVDVSKGTVKGKITAPFTTTQRHRDSATPAGDAKGAITIAPKNGAAAFVPPQADTTDLTARYRSRLRITASSVWSGWPASRLIDGNPQTAWFSATGDSAALGKTPSFVVTFPEPVTISRLRVLGNREPGYVNMSLAVLEAQVELIDSKGNALRTLTTKYNGESRDLEFNFKPAVSNVLSVDFRSLVDEGNKNPYRDVALGEVVID